MVFFVKDFFVSFIIFIICFHWVFFSYTFWRWCLNSLVIFIKIMWYNSMSSKVSVVFLFFILSSNCESVLRTRCILSKQCCTFKLNWLRYCEIHTSHRFSLFIKTVVVRCICCAIKIVVKWLVKTMIFLFVTDSIRCLVFLTTQINLAVFISVGQ